MTLHMRPRTITVAVVVAFSLANLSCEALQQIQRTMVNISRCQFRLGSVSSFSLAGIPLSGKTSYTLSDGAHLISAFSKRQLPATFTLDLVARNPNDGTGGTPKASATMTGFAWTLIIDDTMTVHGDIPTPITIPGTGQETIIPLQMKLDLVEFFGNSGYDHILNLALALGGLNRSTSRIVLRAQPTIHTDYGALTYPGEINIIDKEFRTE